MKVAVINNNEVEIWDRIVTTKRVWISKFQVWMDKPVKRGMLIQSMKFSSHEEAKLAASEMAHSGYVGGTF